MAEKIIIGCRLPHGIELRHPLKPEIKVELAGKNKSLVLGADHMTTEVDAEFWNTWKVAHKDFAPLTSGAIFEAKNVAAAAAVAAELKGEKTGFEPMPSDKASLKKQGLKRSDDKDPD